MKASEQDQQNAEQEDKVEEMPGEEQARVGEHGEQKESSVQKVEDDAKQDELAAEARKEEVADKKEEDEAAQEQEVAAEEPTPEKIDEA